MNRIHNHSTYVITIAIIEDKCLLKSNSLRKISQKYWFSVADSDLLRENTKQRNPYFYIFYTMLPKNF